MTSPRSLATVGIDVGTTETKAGVVTLDGRLLGLARRPHSTAVDPQTGRAEQEPEAWWRGVVGAVREAVAEASAGVGVEILALTVDGHGPTLVAVDERGIAVRPAITWQDTRSSADRAALEARTGVAGWDLGILPAAAWLEANDADSARRTRWYLNVWEALGLRLTGVAAGTHLPGAPAELASVADRGGLGADRVPPPLATGGRLGGLLPEAAEALRLPAGTPVVAGLVDSHASLHGARLLDAGDAIDVGGAAGGFGLYWDGPLEAAGSFTAHAPLPGLWLVGGAFAATGTALDWLRDAVLGGRVGTGELVEAAARVALDAEPLVFLPYLAGERSPLWDRDARGAFVGLSVTHGAPALTRAVLEAAAFAIRQLGVGIEAAGGEVRVMRVCGGPARSEAWNRIKADATGWPVEVPAILETAVVGSAIVAAVGVGAQPGLRTAIEAMTRIVSRIEPDPRARAGYDARFETYRGLYPALQSTRVPAMAT